MSPVKGVPSEGVRALKEKGTTCVKTLPPLGGALGGSSTWDIPGDVGGREQIPGGWWMSQVSPQASADQPSQPSLTVTLLGGGGSGRGLHCQGVILRRCSQGTWRNRL